MTSRAFPPRKLPALLLAACALLSACTTREASSAQTLMQVVAGAYDRSADDRARLPDRVRRSVRWTSTPPIAAREVRVTYDSDQRPVAWRLDLSGQSQSLPELLGTEQLTALGEVQGRPVLSVQDGLFAGALVVEGAEEVAVVSQPYALRYEESLRDLAVR